MVKKNVFMNDEKDHVLIELGSYRYTMPNQEFREFAAHCGNVALALPAEAASTEAEIIDVE